MQTHRLDMRADSDFVSTVDDWRRREPDIPGRSEAVRRLVLLGLAAAGKPAAVEPDRAAIKPDRKPTRHVRKAMPHVSASDAIMAKVAGKSWRDQRGALRRAIVAHPGWEVIRDRDGVSVASLSSQAQFRPICAELGLAVAALL